MGYAHTRCCEACLGYWVKKVVGCGMIVNLVDHNIFPGDLFYPGYFEVNWDIEMQRILRHVWYFCMVEVVVK